MVRISKGHDMSNVFCFGPKLLPSEEAILIAFKQDNYCNMLFLLFLYEYPSIIDIPRHFSIFEVITGPPINFSFHVILQSIHRNTLL